MAKMPNAQLAAQNFQGVRQYGQSIKEGAATAAQNRLAAAKLQSSNQLQQQRINLSRKRLQQAAAQNAQTMALKESAMALDMANKKRTMQMQTAEFNKSNILSSFDNLNGAMAGDPFALRDAQNYFRNTSLYSDGFQGQMEKNFVMGEVNKWQANATNSKVLTTINGKYEIVNGQEAIKNQSISPRNSTVISPEEVQMTRQEYEQYVNIGHPAVEGRTFDEYLRDKHSSTREPPFPVDISEAELEMRSLKLRQFSNELMKVDGDFSKLAPKWKKFGNSIMKNGGLSPNTTFDDKAFEETQDDGEDEEPEDFISDKIVLGLTSGHIAKKVMGTPLKSRDELPENPDEWNVAHANYFLNNMIPDAPQALVEKSKKKVGLAKSFTEGLETGGGFWRDFAVGSGQNITEVLGGTLDIVYVPSSHVAEGVENIFQGLNPEKKAKWDPAPSLSSQWGPKDLDYPAARKAGQIVKGLTAEYGKANSREEQLKILGKIENQMLPYFDKKTVNETLYKVEETSSKARQAVSAELAESVLLKSLSYENGLRSIKRGQGISLTDEAYARSIALQEANQRRPQEKETAKGGNNQGNLQNEDMKAFVKYYRDEEGKDPDFSIPEVAADYEAFVRNKPKK